MLLPIVGYLFPFFAERFPPLQPYCVTYGGSILDHAHGLAGQDADVIFFGDSTAMFGVDTERLSRKLGLKVLNIPNTLGSLANTGDWTLREYLDGNKPPRLIVFQTAPWNLDFHQTANPGPYEGDEEIVRHADPREFFRFTGAHPLEIFYFPFRFYASPTPLTNLRAWGKLNLAPVVQGFSPNLNPVSLQPSCTFPDIELHLQATGSVRELLSKYRTSKTMTVSYLSPIPNCTNVDQILARHYPGLTVAPPVVVPPQDIVADFTHAHPMRAYVPVTTDIAYDFVRRQLLRGSAAEP